MKTLASAVFCCALFVGEGAMPAYADHLRDAERLSHTLHHQTVDYARWLVYHLPPCDEGIALRRDARQIYVRVGRLQQMLLFAEGDPHALHRAEHLVVDLQECVAEALDRVHALQEQARYAHRHRRPSPQRKPGFGFRVGHGFSVRLVDHHAEPVGNWNSVHRPSRKLIGPLNVVEGKLHAMERTLNRLGGYCQH